jgi:hypothetical protein
MCLQFCEVERKREPATVERLADDRASAPIAMADDQPLIGQKIERMANRDPSNSEFANEVLKGWQPIAGLPFAARDPPSQDGGHSTIRGNAETLSTTRGKWSLGRPRALYRSLGQHLLRVTRDQLALRRFAIHIALLPPRVDNSTAYDSWQRHISESPQLRTRNR